MSKRVVFIRHGESDSNAGGVAASSFKDIKLTPKGKQQAQALADSLNCIPDLIICSDFKRAQETAEPILCRYADVKYEIDTDIREFAILNGDTVKGTTVHDRASRVSQFWASNDPEYCDGGDAESFKQFVTRATNFIEKIKEKEEKMILVVSHSLTILLINLIHDLNNEEIDLKVLMKKFDEFKKKPVPNCSTVELMF